MIHSLLDTNHLSAMMNGNPVIRQKINDISALASFGVAMTSVGELWYMVFNSAKPQKNKERLDDALQDFVGWEFNGKPAVEFGRVKTELRKNCRPIPDPDTQIAAIVRVNGLTVLVADAHFNNISDLKVENWLV